ncbi:hypothetical protein, partial [Enterococcus durans]|uniref:hypothetical protein n=1 Tax=Enterococcus durans TaxID=53345 RepID=UPI001C00C547
TRCLFVIKKYLASLLSLSNNTKYYRTFFYYGVVFLEHIPRSQKPRFSKGTNPLLVSYILRTEKASPKVMTTSKDAFF